jgi:hypothetical protein
VTALYPSIPIEKALECIRERLIEDETLEGRTKWSVENIMELLKICLQTYFKTLDGKLWKQTDGCPIGKSISGEIAEIYLNWFENEFVYKDELFPKILLWKRMRDDILIIWKSAGKSPEEIGEELENLVERLNSHERRIQFTWELEKDRTLPFLDVLIERKDLELITRVYSKSTHTQKYINWRSNHSNNCKLGTLKGLIHRAHELCDEKEDLMKEISLLKEVFRDNDYPPRYVNETVDEMWKIELKRKIQKQMNESKEKEKESEYRDIIQFPYVRGFSEKLQKALKEMKIGVVMKRTDTIGSRICNMKAEIGKEKSKDIVYWIECETCEKPYIGETSQFFSERRNQHQRDIKNGSENNGIFCHLQKNPNHKIKWEDFKIVTKEEHWRKRKIKESVIINMLNSTENFSEMMNLEKGFLIDPIWRTVDKELREELRLPGEKTM